MTSYWRCASAMASSFLLALGCADPCPPEGLPGSLYCPPGDASTMDASQPPVDSGLAVDAQSEIDSQVDPDSGLDAALDAWMDPCGTLSPGESCTDALRCSVAEACTCGDGALDAGEECDDFSAGCDLTCRWVCSDDRPCEDVVCHGPSRCDPSAHRCVQGDPSPPGTPCDGGYCDDAGTCIECTARGDERCDGVDDDCDGRIDEGTERTFHRDADGDGFGDVSMARTACEPGDGWVADDTDCDDSRAAISPVAPEICNGTDDDCDAAVDETATDARVWHRDADEDGYGDPDAEVRACEPPDGHVEDGTDCDDMRAQVSPAALEVCNVRDDDCDGGVDESSAADAPTWYRDADSDGYGDAAVSRRACVVPEGFVADSTDCDDARDTVRPGAPETCNAVDDDCDGSVDEGSIDAPTWYRDADSDGYGDAAATARACTVPDGYVGDGTDCDDTTRAVSPAASELCNGADDDCDAGIDEDATDAARWYRDADSDGYGDASMSVLACARPMGFAPRADDCDDTRASINPAAAEVCNGRDDDCDGAMDEPDAVDALSWARDADGDTWGNAADTRRACAAPPGYIARAGDCDDTRATTFPGATERCNGLDDDCDGAVDEPDAVDAPTWYRDADGDGWGNAGAPLRSCGPVPGYVGLSGDCNDGTPAIRPGAPDACDFVDQDCNGIDGPGGGVTCGLCGDGYIDAAYGEACDVAGGPGCRSDCRAILCDTASAGPDGDDARSFYVRPGSGTCYWFDPDVRSRGDAIGQCGRGGAYLMRWRADATERDDVWNNVHPRCGTCRVWAGLQRGGGGGRDGSPGNWVWDGEGAALSSVELNWRGDEPSGDGSCVEWGGSGGNVLNDLSCGASRDFICERPRPGVVR